MTCGQVVLSKLRIKGWHSADSPGALAEMASDMMRLPLLDVPPQTPKSSNTAGAAQQRPPASSSPLQHLYVIQDERLSARHRH
jgi:hypothetical protein